MVVWEVVKGIIVAAIGVIGSVIQTVIGVAYEFWKWVWSGMKEIVVGVLSAVVTIVSTAIETVAGIIKAIMQFIMGDWKGAWETMKSTVSNAGAGLASAASSVMQGAFNAVKNWFGNFKEAGANIVGMIADGIMGAVGKVTNAIGSVTAKIREFLPFSPAKQGALRDIHKLNFGGTIADSINRDAYKPIQAVKAMTSGIRDTWSNQVGSLKANVGGSIQRNVQTSVRVQNNGLNSMFAELLAQRQYLVLDTGAFVGHTQHAYDMAQGSAINLGKRVKR